MKIIPAKLPSDFREIEDKVDLVKDLVKTVQIDICDGKFVPSFTWPYKKHDMNYESLLREERGMPAWEKIDYEFDLMIAKPSQVFADWVKAGASRIIVHLEAMSPDEMDKIVSEWAGSVEIGVAIGINTSIESLTQCIESNNISLVQCMGIEKIGFQGQKFDERVLQKVIEIKKKWPNIIVSVDGGVSLESALALKNAGVDRLVVGSAIFEVENIPEVIHNFKSL